MIKQKIINRQGVELKYRLFTNNESKCILFIPGLAQSYGGFVKNLAEQARENDFDFIYPTVQNSGIVREFKQIYPDGSENNIVRGACFDKIRNSIADIDCLIKLVTEKYDEVVLVAYCFGCDKILNYLNKYPNNKIVGVSLLAPQDMFTTIYGENGNLHVQQAIKNIKSGNANALIDKKLFSFCDVSSETYLDMILNKDFYQFPIFSEDIKFRHMIDFNIPIQLVIGEEDRGIKNNEITFSPDEYLYVISKSIKSQEHIVIPNATHSFSQDPNGVVEAVLRFASNITQNNKVRGL